MRKPGRTGVEKKLLNYENDEILSNVDDLIMGVFRNKLRE
jgi:hypothetical protein